MRSFFSNKKQVHQRILLLGNDNVGKFSFVTRLKDDQFYKTPIDDSPEAIEYQRSSEKDKLTFILDEDNGSALIASMRSMPSINLIVILVDLSSKSRDKDIVHYQKKAALRAPGVPVMVIGTKMDLIEDNRIESGDIFQTSALTGEGFDAVNDEITRLLTHQSTCCLS